MDGINKTRSNCSKFKFNLHENTTINADISWEEGLPHVSLLTQELEKSGKKDKVKLLHTLGAFLSSNETLRVEFYKQDGIHTILKYLQEDDWEIAGTTFHVLETSLCQKLGDKLLLTTQETFRMILRVLKKDSMNHKKSSMYLVASIVQGNVLGQALTRETGFLHHLIEMFYDALESMSLVDEDKSHWYLLCTAIKVCVCNPQNIQNQFQTSLIIPKAITFLNNWSLQAFNKNFSEYVQILISLLSGIITDNPTNQLGFCLYAGVQTILRGLSVLEGWHNAPANITGVQEKLVTLLDAAACSSPANGKNNFYQGAIPLLLQLLRKFGDQQKFSVLMALTHLLETSAACRKEFLKENGITAVVVATVNVNEDSRAGRAASVLLKLCAEAVQNEDISNTGENSFLRTDCINSTSSKDTIHVCNTMESCHKMKIFEHNNVIDDRKGDTCCHQDVKRNVQIQRKEEKSKECCHQMKGDGNKNMRDIKLSGRELGICCYQMRDEEKQTEVNIRRYDITQQMPKFHEVQIAAKQTVVSSELPDRKEWTVNERKIVDHDIKDHRDPVEIVNKQSVPNDNPSSHCCTTNRSCMQKTATPLGDVDGTSCSNRCGVNDIQQIQKQIASHPSRESICDKTVEREIHIPTSTFNAIISDRDRCTEKSVLQTKSSINRQESVSANKDGVWHNGFEDYENHQDREKNLLKAEMSHGMVNGLSHIYSVKGDNTNNMPVLQRESETQSLKFYNSESENIRNVRETVDMLQNSLNQTDVEKLQTSAINKWSYIQKSQNKQTTEKSISKSRDALNQLHMKSKAEVYSSAMPGLFNDIIRRSEEIGMKYIAECNSIQSNKEFPLRSDANRTQKSHSSTSQFPCKEVETEYIPGKSEENSRCNLKSPQQTNISSQLVTRSKSIHENCNQKGRINVAQDIVHKSPYSSRDPTNICAQLSEKVISNNDRPQDKIEKAAPLANANSIFSYIDQQYDSLSYSNPSSIGEASSEIVIPQKGSSLASEDHSLKSYNSHSIHTPINVSVNSVNKIQTHLTQANKYSSARTEDPKSIPIFKTSFGENPKETLLLKNKSNPGTVSFLKEVCYDGDSANIYKKQLSKKHKLSTSEKGKDVYEFTCSDFENSVSPQWSCKENVKPTSRPGKYKPHNMLRFTKVELQNLFSGVARYGLDFKAIRRAYTFHRKRTAKDLYLKWRNSIRTPRSCNNYNNG